MDTEWQVGASGLFVGSPGKGWKPVGAYAYPVNGIAQIEQGRVLGTETGCWCVPTGGGRWVQWHDETLTSVLGLAVAPVGVGIVAASAYGIATAQADASGMPRWIWHSDELGVNARYSNAILADPADALRWLVGTEAGVLVREHAEGRWVYTSLMDRPVRALCCAAGAFWAGTDGGGIWRSVDGVTWQRAGTGLDDATVYALAWTGDRLLAGLEGGLAVGDGAGCWTPLGPKLRVRTVGAGADVWLAGANPGGLWFSDDAGRKWRKTGEFVSVRTVAPQEEG